jgi:hypothetical protein
MNTHQLNAGQVQVLGANLQIVIDGFQAFTVLSNKILIEEGLGTDDGTGKVKFEAGNWYSLERWLNTLKRVGTEFGHFLLYQSGQTTPKNAVFPPTVKDIHSALQCIDVAYHMNHAVQGESMFSPNTGEMREGIGHYKYSHTQGTRRITIESSTPYPCDFDQGIIVAMAQRFEPSARLMHDASKPCRKNGGASCSYHINWR